MAKLKGGTRIYGDGIVDGSVLVGTGTSTGTASQPLQVTGGAYVSGNLGIGTTNPTSKISVIGDATISGITALNNVYVAGVGTYLSGNLKIRNPANTFEYSITGSAIVANRILTLPLITATDTLAVLGLSQTFSAAQTFSSTFTHSATTTNFVASSYTTGTVTIGGAQQTGAITVGQATTSQTLNLATGAAGVGTTKTINLGTGGASGSFTQINIGPTSGVGTISINTGTNLGIGSTTPTSKLDVVGDIKVSGASTLGTVKISSGIITATSGIITYYGDGQYLSNIPSSVAIGTVAPSSPIVGGIWYNSNLGRTFVYYNDGDSSQWVDAAPFNIPQETLLTPARNDTLFTATAGQTVFVVSYKVGYIDVYLNGIRLSGTEFVANTGTYIILAEPAAENDVISVVEISVGIGDTGAAGLPGQSLTIGTRMGAYIQYANVGTGLTISLRSGVGTATF